ncbi:MAG: hypothetical protein Kow0026_19980 [Oricola sp.]
MTKGIEARFRGKRGGFSLDVEFAAPGCGVTGMFGPSGCGKTTILRCMAGLTRIDDGYLSVGGEVWQQPGRFLATHRRPIGYVFQEARLFPHLSVLDNLRYGLRRTKERGHPVTLDAVVGLLGIAPLMTRTPHNLSGGERQRIAIGRALLSRPRLLLMDEPLSALDRQSKQEILPFLESLVRDLAVPIVYVSHDLAEIERLADHLVLVERGRVRAAGDLRTLATDLSLPLAHGPQAAAVVDVTVVRHDPVYGLSECTVGGIEFLVPGNLGAPGARRRLRIPATEVSLLRTEHRDSSVLNMLPARIVEASEPRAGEMLVLLEAGHDGSGARLLSSVTCRSWDRLGLALGDRLFAQVKGMALADEAAAADGNGTAACAGPRKRSGAADSGPAGRVRRELSLP